MNEVTDILNTNILEDVKTMLGGIFKEYTHFNMEILLHINSVVATVTQLGAGPEDGVIITEESIWSDVTDNTTLLNLIRSYISLKVKLKFDLTTNASLYNMLAEETKELEWRIEIQADSMIHKEGIN